MRARAVCRPRFLYATHLGETTHAQRGGRGDARRVGRTSSLRTDVPGAPDLVPHLPRRKGTVGKPGGALTRRAARVLSPDPTLHVSGKAARRRGYERGDEGAD